MNGVNIVGVQFRRAGKIYDFLGRDVLVQVGDQVIVDTERGPSLAEVVRIGFQPENQTDIAQMKPVMRVAAGHEIVEPTRLSSKYAEEFASERIKRLKLEMRLIKAELQFGGGKVIFYFSAPGRVDFRDLVKELATGLKARVELKQVGARDEAKLTGGLGICGREFCCSSFLREFVPVSIKMAKNQNLALNPAKVSGGCGRLLCCLTYEDETYTHLKKTLLPRGTRVRLDDGSIGDVLKGDILNQVMLVETSTGEQRTVHVDNMQVISRSHAVPEDGGSEWGDDLDLGSLMGNDDKAGDDGKRRNPRPRRKAGPEGSGEG